MEKYKSCWIALGMSKVCALWKGKGGVGMAEITENGKTIDYDKISRRVLLDKLVEIDDIEITPKALNRILCVIQNMPPYEMC